MKCHHHLLGSISLMRMNGSEGTVLGQHWRERIGMMQIIKQIMDP
jgi:hypothetical protein